MYKAKPVADSNAGISPTSKGPGVRLGELQRGSVFISLLGAWEKQDELVPKSRLWESPLPWSLLVKDFPEWPGKQNCACFASIWYFMHPCTSFKGSDETYWMKLQPSVTTLPSFCRKLDGCIRKATFVLWNILEADVNSRSYCERDVQQMKV